MKMFIVFVFSLFLFSSDVFADGVTFEFKENKNKYDLVVLYDGDVITYDDAYYKYDVDRYMMFNYRGKELYYDYGKPCSYDTYYKGSSREDADKRCDNEKNCVRVTNTKEFIKELDKIYKSEIVGVYKFIYSELEYSNFNIDEIEKFYEKNILTDINKNVYKFNEYGYKFPVRFIPLINETETIVDFNTLMMTKNEINKLDEFNNYFLDYFKNANDYEKIVSIYSFIKSYATFDTGQYDNMLSAYLSPYDIIFNKKMVCIGASATFQYYMEKFGIESYIVDRVVEKDIRDRLFVTEHTYNVVKLENKYYIVDIIGDKLLVGRKGDYRKDRYSTNLNISYSDYKIKNVDFVIDYEGVNNKIKEIGGVSSTTTTTTTTTTTSKLVSTTVKKEEIVEKEDKKDNKVLVYTIAAIILIVIGFVIYFVVL